MVQGATIARLAGELTDGRATAESLARGCLDRIADPGGEGARCFIAIDENKVRDQARASDLLRRHGIAPSPLAGIPVSVKDLFDVMGEVTRAGSTVLADAPPAKCDAPAIARLRAAGAVLTGRNNMTEFAYSGVGLNPHYGTPANPWNRETRRIPGGSTSGGAVSVADGMAALAIGSDTGGSCRIPAALCGLVGFKPTAARIPLQGAFPLSSSLDSIGALGKSVACVALADAVMAGEEHEVPIIVQPSRLRLGLPKTLVQDGLDDDVAHTFEAALRMLRDAGVHIEDMAFDELGELPALADRGGIAAVEAGAVHRTLMAAHGEAYDPRVRARIALGAGISGAEYAWLLRRRAELIANAARRITPYDAVIVPTVPIVAPPFSAFETDDEFNRLNRLLLRNPSCLNALDCCAISLPCHRPGAPPVGLMLAASHGHDRQLFHIAASVEAALAPLRSIG